MTKRSVKPPMTMAMRMLREHNVHFEPHFYDWEPNGGTAASSAALGVDEHRVIKTLIFERDDKQPFCVLMHGDREVSTKSLARILGCKSCGPCAPEVASRHSGYQIGGTSPFGLRKSMPIYMQQTIAELPTIFINGGNRGFLVELAPAALVTVLRATAVSAEA